MFDRPIANMDLIPNIQTPLWIVVGGKDGSTPEGQARELARKVPSARVSVYPDSGHSPFAEEPDRFNHELMKLARETATANDSAPLR
jgi:pimeloyl-ACP methyl ester carboxylesterase